MGLLLLLLHAMYSFDLQGGLSQKDFLRARLHVVFVVVVVVDVVVVVVVVVVAVVVGSCTREGIQRSSLRWKTCQQVRRLCCRKRMRQLLLLLLLLLLLFCCC